MRIDLWPNGFDGEGIQRTLLDLYVANDGSGSSEFGNYDVYTSDPRYRSKPNYDREGWLARVVNVPRDEGLGPLLARIAEHLTPANGEMSGDYRANGEA